MHQISFMLPPLLGLFVGYVTNSLAVRMLFRPYKARYLGKVRVPFTPGVIPKRQKDIGKAMGQMIQNHLLTASSIHRRLASPDVRSAITAEAVDWAFNEIEDKTIQGVAGDFIDEDQLQMRMDELTSWLAVRIAKQVNSLDLHALFSEEIHLFLTKRLDSFSMLLFSRDLVDSLIRSAESTLKEKLSEHDAAHLQPFIEAELRHVAGLDAQQTLLEFGLTREALQRLIADAYDRALSRGLYDLVSAIDVASIVEDQIVEMNVRELETLIVSILKRELREIVNLGGLIGFVLGMLSLLTR